MIFKVYQLLRLRYSAIWIKHFRKFIRKRAMKFTFLQDFCHDHLSLSSLLSKKMVPWVWKSRDCLSTSITNRTCTTTSPLSLWRTVPGTSSSTSSTTSYSPPSSNSSRTPMTKSSWLLPQTSHSPQSPTILTWSISFPRCSVKLSGSKRYKKWWRDLSTRGSRLCLTVMV